MINQMMRNNICKNIEGSFSSTYIAQPFLINYCMLVTSEYLISEIIFGPYLINCI